MSENDPLKAVLREWQAPEPSAALDQRIRAGFLAMRSASRWARFWSARVSVPVPVLAAVLLLAAVAWLVESRPAVQPVPPSQPGVVTRLEATGFQPEPNGAARVEEVKQ
jgi:hypothetical protein